MLYTPNLIQMIDLLTVRRDKELPLIKTILLGYSYVRRV